MSRALPGSQCRRGSSKGLWAEWTAASRAQALADSLPPQHGQTGPETGTLGPAIPVLMALHKSPTSTFPAQSIHGLAVSMRTQGSGKTQEKEGEKGVR